MIENPLPEEATVMPAEPTAPITLAGVINGMELSDSERRSVLAADAMPISLKLKGMLVVTDIFVEKGVFRAGEVLGFDPEETVNARDTVRTDPNLESTWIIYTALKQSGFAEVAIYKRAGVPHDEIAQTLGIERSEVDRISRALSDVGLNSRPNNSQVQGFNEFCGIVEQADVAAGDSPLTARELAEELGVSILRVNRARVRNRAQGRIAPPSKKDVEARMKIVRKAILGNPLLSNDQIFSSLPKEVQDSISASTIADQRSALIAKKEVKSKREARRSIPEEIVILDATEI